MRAIVGGTFFILKMCAIQSVSQKLFILGIIATFSNNNAAGVVIQNNYHIHRYIMYGRCSGVVS
jgi:hypothetical protein